LESLFLTRILRAVLPAVIGLHPCAARLALDRLWLGRIWHKRRGNGNALIVAVAPLLPVVGNRLQPPSVDSCSHFAPSFLASIRAWAAIASSRYTECASHMFWWSSCTQSASPWS